MSKVPPEPSAAWLEANGFFPDAFSAMGPQAKESLLAAYQKDLERQAARAADPFYDLVELIDVPAPECFSDAMPDYSILPPGVEPGSREHEEYDRFLERYHGYNEPRNPEIAA